MTISSPSKASATESAPVGQNRFREAIVLTSLHINNYDATQFGPQCMQQDEPSNASLAFMDEDCLYLNIWTPNINATDGNVTADLLPVLFWVCSPLARAQCMFKHLKKSQIHGGAFVTGSGSSPLTDGRAFMSSGDVLLVSIQIIKIT